MIYECFCCGSIVWPDWAIFKALGNKFALKSCPKRFWTFGLFWNWLMQKLLWISFRQLLKTFGQLLKTFGGQGGGRKQGDLSSLTCVKKKREIELKSSKSLSNAPISFILILTTMWNLWNFNLPVDSYACKCPTEFLGVSLQFNRS